MPGPEEYTAKDFLCLIGARLDSPLWLIDGFCPKFWEMWLGPTKAIYHSVKVDGVVILVGGGELRGGG